MNSRILSGVLALVGAVVLAIGSWEPYAEGEGFKLRMIDNSGPHFYYWLGVEPAAVIVAAVVLGILLLVHPPYRLTPGALLASGVQTTLLFAGVMGFYHELSDKQFVYKIEWGGWVGIVGSLLIAGAGMVLLLAPDEEPAAAGAAQRGASGAAWYPDPGQAGQLRYWDGQLWTSHTAPQAAAAAPPMQPPPPASAPPPPPSPLSETATQITPQAPSSSQEGDPS
jgi:Protein of unknown function (DUF2510)